jgi:hypothetical protein
MSETRVRAIRGATTVDSDTRENVVTRTQELIAALFARNDIVEDDLISIVFTATDEALLGQTLEDHFEHIGGVAGGRDLGRALGSPELLDDSLRRHELECGRCLSPQSFDHRERECHGLEADPLASARVLGQATNQPAQDVPLENVRLDVHEGLDRFGIAKVRHQDDPVRRQHDDAVGSAEPGQVADVEEIRHDQRIDSGTGQGGDGPGLTFTVLRHGRSLSPTTRALDGTHRRPRR